MTISPTAARLYMLGEDRFAQGRFDEAVALWGHTMLQLPPDPSADVVRHELLARMAHGLLQGYLASGDREYLEDGRAMCERYIAKHEALLGDGEEARAQRGEIYELLYEFDSRLEPLEEAAEVQGEGEHPPTPVELAAAETSDVDRSPPPADAGPSEGDDDDGERRLIEVPRIAWARTSDPTVRRYHGDDRFLGPSLVDVGHEDVHGARILVRAGGRPRPTAAGADDALNREARRAGLGVLEAARPMLERCYEVAMAREPVLAARAVVELTIEADGAVSVPRVLEGMVVDPEGDACAAQALRSARVDPPTTGEPLALSMPIHFFFQDATKIGELIRIETGFTHSRGYVRTSHAPGLPPISEFGTIAEPYLAPSPAKQATRGLQLSPPPSR